jgi:hypothetical protein
MPATLALNSAWCIQTCATTYLQGFSCAILLHQSQLSLSLFGLSTTAPGLFKDVIIMLCTLSSQGPSQLINLSMTGVNLLLSLLQLQVQVSNTVLQLLVDIRQVEGLLTVGARLLCVLKMV